MCEVVVRKILENKENTWNEANLLARNREQ